MTSRLEKRGVPELVGLFEQAAAAHGRATEAGDYRVANKSHDRATALYRELRRRGAQEALLPLLDSSDPGVRCWAAAHVLDFSPERAERALESIAGVVGSLVSFTAQEILEEWRKGTLPPVP